MQCGIIYTCVCVDTGGHIYYAYILTYAHSFCVSKELILS